MAKMLQCLVNYFGFGTKGQRRPLRYCSSHVVAGPGPSDGSGVASPLLSAGGLHDIFQIVQQFHVVAEGGAGGDVGS